MVTTGMEGASGKRKRRREEGERQRKRKDTLQCIDEHAAAANCCPAKVDSRLSQLPAATAVATHQTSQLSLLLLVRSSCCWHPRFVLLTCSACSAEMQSRSAAVNTAAFSCQEAVPLTDSDSCVQQRQHGQSVEAVERTWSAGQQARQHMKAADVTGERLGMGMHKRYTIGTAPQRSRWCQDYKQVYVEFYLHLLSENNK